jgi:hypothetical protein
MPGRWRLRPRSRHEGGAQRQRSGSAAAAQRQRSGSAAAAQRQRSGSAAAAQRQRSGTCSASVRCARGRSLARRSERQRRDMSPTGTTAVLRSCILIAPVYVLCAARVVFLIIEHLRIYLSLSPPTRLRLTVHAQGGAVALLRPWCVALPLKRPSQRLSYCPIADTVNRST